MTIAPQHIEPGTTVIPWGIANHLPDCDCLGCQAVGGWYNRIVECLRFWRISVDEAIITSHPDPNVCVPVMQSMVTELAPLRIIPGVDPNPTLRRRLDNVDGWRVVAEDVGRLTEIADSDRFVINAEKSILSMRKGEYIPDWDKVLEGLKLLPTDVAYIWYPSISCRVEGPPDDRYSKDDLVLQTKFLRLVVETLPDVTLTTFEHMTPESATYAPEIARQEYVKKHFKVPTIPRVWFYEYSYWHPSQFAESVATCQSPAMTAYIGAGESVSLKLSRTAPLVLRRNLQRRLADASDKAHRATQRAETAEGKLSQIRELVGESK
jgi:hypothetical protein